MCFGKGWCSLIGDRIRLLYSVLSHIRKSVALRAALLIASGRKLSSSLLGGVR